MEVYEVLVEPHKNGNNGNHNGHYENAVRKLHYERSSPQQAKLEGGKHGVVKGVYKVDRDKLRWKPERVKLEKPKDEIDMGNPYESAVAMDEFIWKKVQIRRYNMLKEKQETTRD
jgi:hypothetical protein